MVDLCPEPHSTSRLSLSPEPKTSNAEAGRRLDHTQLYSPLYGGGGVECQGLATFFFSLASLSPLSLSRLSLSRTLNLKR